MDSSGVRQSKDPEYELDSGFLSQRSGSIEQLRIACARNLQAIILFELVVDFIGFLAAVQNSICFAVNSLRDP